jgi:phage/plasmid-associated DNA primase
MMGDGGNNTTRDKQLRSVADVYRQTPAKYRAVRSTKRTEEDVASLVIDLDEAALQGAVLAFEVGPDKYDVYVATEAGIWERQEGYRKIKDRIRAVRRQLNDRLLEPLRFVMCLLRSDASFDDEPEVQAKFKDAEREFSLVDFFHTKLGSSAFVSSVTQLVLQRKALDTENMGFRDPGDLFDVRADCVGFTDGVYDFAEQRLVTGPAAQRFYVSQTVGYAYEDVIACSSEDFDACTAFLSRIHTDPELLGYVLRRISNAVRGIKEQLILVHYNVAGSNGKTTFFSLVKWALGSLFVKGNSGVLSTPANPHGPNEELMSLRCKRLALFSEPSAKKALNVAFLKELTGGDEQSARGMHSKKVTFTFLGLVNLLCNKVPEFDDFDGGIKRRLRCVPYCSEFVDPVQLVDPVQFASLEPSTARSVFPLDKTIDRHFPRWRFALMKLILRVAGEPDADGDPPAVREHTQRLIQREDAMSAFVLANVAKTGCRRDVLRRQDLWARYLQACSQANQKPVKYSEFSDEVGLRLGPPLLKSNRLSNFWRGMRIVDCGDADTEDDEDDGCEEVNV